MFLLIFEVKDGIGREKIKFKKGFMNKKEYLVIWLWYLIIWFFEDLIFKIKFYFWFEVVIYFMGKGYLCYNRSDFGFIIFDCYNFSV